MPPISSESSSRRRQTRLRRDYLYRKSLATRDQATYEHKRLVRQALAEGKPLPTEVRATYDKLQTEITAEDARTGNTTAIDQQIDDEYAQVGLIEPRVCVTTSRDPSSRLAQFAKEIKLLIPNATRINRGNQRVDELTESCRMSDMTDLVVVQETRGEPDGLVICHLPVGPTAYFSLSGTVMRHDLDPPAAPMSEAYPHILLEQFETDLGQRVGMILKALFPVPKAESQRVMAFCNESDYIQVRHYMYQKPGHDQVTLHEVGPRFAMRLYQIRLGTLEDTHAEKEYVLRPYQNTASKRNVL